MDETDFKYDVVKTTRLFTEDGKRIDVFNVKVTSMLGEEPIERAFTVHYRRQEEMSGGGDGSPILVQQHHGTFIGKKRREPTGAYSPSSTIVNGDINRVLPPHVNAVSLVDEDISSLKSIIGDALIELCKKHLREQGRRFTHYPQAFGRS